MKNIKTKEIKQIRENNIQWYYFIPLLLIVAIVPLIVRGKYIVLDQIKALFWDGKDYYIDIYSFWKAVWLMILCGTSLFLYITLRVDKKMYLKKESHYSYYIALIIYIIFVFISTITSYYKSIVYMGFVDMCQGMFVLMSYAVLTFLMINYINNERDIKLFSKAFAFLIIIEGIIGIGQYLGADFFHTKLGVDLMIPNDIILESINHQFGKYTIYGTLFNTNFVGSFAAIVLPLSIAFFIRAENIKSKIIFGFCIFFSIALWIGCNSRAGYVGVIAAIIVAIVLLRKKIFKNYKIVGICLATVLLVGIIFNFASGGKILDQFSKLNIFSEADRIEAYVDENVRLEEIKLSKDNFSIISNKATLIGKYENDDVSFYDKDMNKLETSKDENGYIVFKDENYSKFKISNVTSDITMVSVNDVTIRFTPTENGVKVFGIGNRLTEHTPSKGFAPLEGYETFASSRGYIWSKSIMMLPNVLFKGYGPDTFVVAFPQDDYVDKMNAGYSAHTIIDKPHNMYLQIAINTGVISLIALLALWGIYIIRGFMLYNSMNFDSTEKVVGFACMISVIGYLVAGIFNDQIVSVAPLFWLVLGMGISINEKLIKAKKTLS